MEGSTCWNLTKGGMFVQSEKFVAEHQDRTKDISIYGQESNQTTWRFGASIVPRWSGTTKDGFWTMPTRIWKRILWLTIRLIQLEEGACDAPLRGCGWRRFCSWMGAIWGIWSTGASASSIFFLNCWCQTAVPLAAPPSWTMGWCLPRRVDLTPALSGHHSGGELRRPPPAGGTPALLSKNSLNRYSGALRNPRALRIIAFTTCPALPCSRQWGSISSLVSSTRPNSSIIPATKPRWSIFSISKRGTYCYNHFPLA